ncbi:hypothetical protein EYF80_015452 [Liparis tanakae]|uniref:Uncharacterized protein n=1 Tax=Liparis tanakae TaxID=230148 RepID=A0A4Z2I8I2_9TELE|nr:hypothetical protein EYF80_015452 [Liparis tanakae]
MSLLAAIALSQQCKLWASRSIICSFNCNENQRNECLYTDYSVHYLVPGVLDDANFLGQDLNEPMSLDLTEHHATDGGHQSLVGQVQRSISRIHRRH